MNHFDKFRVEDTFAKQIENFQELMPFRIREVLLISSLYDSFILEEDGRVDEMLRLEYQELNLSHTAEITHVPSGAEALKQLRSKHFDLIISTPHIDDMNAVALANAIRAEEPKTPIVLLAFANRESKELVASFDTSVFERIFIWQGDYRLLIGIIKYVEDRMNVEPDTRRVGVQSIILIEDNIKFYSSYLPLVYTELMKQSQQLIAEGVNGSHRLLRFRARPKILLCTSYDEAWAYYRRYSDTVLGVISDVTFPKNGVLDPDAGLQFVKNIRSEHEDIPALLQSSNSAVEAKARELGATFLLKGSPSLLHDLSDFIAKHFGFGDFSFCLPGGQVVATAKNLKELEEQILKVPAESIIFHARRNHFSTWLKARTEFSLAHKFRPCKVEDWGTLDGLRNFLVTSLREYRKARRRGVIADFSKDGFDPIRSFARIGGGSLGGKARGLAFVNHLLANYDLRNRFAGVKIFVPTTLCISSDVFDEFLARNGLFNVALESQDDQALVKHFLEAKEFPEAIVQKLAEFLEAVREPLAVRSSSLLEDSQYQPFAGVYATQMLPNNDPDPKIRLKKLLDSIRLVYASTFLKRSRDYIKATEYRLEEEKMAVVVQKMVGHDREGRFYPDFSGVAKSFNFYPIPPQKPLDGVAIVALGLGKTVVGGGNAVRFCPRFPKNTNPFSDPSQAVKAAQKEFFALDMHTTQENTGFETREDGSLREFSLDVAEKDGTLTWCGSTYSAENDALFDGISRTGQRVVTFAPILKHQIFPLPEILNMLLEMGRYGMGAPVEIEFAVNMNVPPGSPKEFAVLQMRPLVLNSEMEELKVDGIGKEKILAQSVQVLGHGAKSDIYDLVVVDIERYERNASKIVAEEVARYNAQLTAEKRPYILLGVGRWGSMDPWLGIPVSWDQISGAVALIETSFKDFNVTPSEGSHFFQNLVSFRVGYFTVNPSLNDSFIDWKWISEQAQSSEGRYTRHLRFEKPLSIRINGRKNKGVILKPGYEA